MSFDLREFADCQYLSLAGEDALFAVQDRNNQTLHPSPLFEAFCKQIEQHKPKVVVVDTLADVNPTDENQRSAALAAHKAVCAGIEDARSSRS